MKTHARERLAPAQETSGLVSATNVIRAGPTRRAPARRPTRSQIFGGGSKSCHFYAPWPTRPDKIWGRPTPAGDLARGKRRESAGSLACRPCVVYSGCRARRNSERASILVQSRAITQSALCRVCAQLASFAPRHAALSVSLQVRHSRIARPECPLKARQEIAQ